MKKERAEPPLSAVKYRIALDSIWQALEGDPRWLVSRLRQGIASCPEQVLAADLIEGKIKPRRPKLKKSTQLEIAKSVAFLERLYPHKPRKAIIPVVAEKYGRSERRVYDALKEFDDDALAQIEQMREPKLRVEKSWQDLINVNGEQVTVEVAEANDLSHVDRDSLQQWLELLLIERKQTLARK